jgi:hypothetical protein
VNSTVSSLIGTMADVLAAGGAFAGGAGGSDMYSGEAARRTEMGVGAKAETEPTTRAERSSFPYFTMVGVILLLLREVEVVLRVGCVWEAEWGERGKIANATSTHHQHSTPW